MAFNLVLGGSTQVPSQNSAAKPLPRLVALDGVRGVLALSVAFFHINIWHGQFEERWLRNLHPVLGFFFVLSGFRLTLLYDRRLKDGKSAVDFVIRRIRRQWSVHLFALGLLFSWELSRAVRATLLGRADEAPSRDLFAKLGTWIRRGEIGWPKAMQRSTQESG
ncbi:MAG TPA: hypothetical protein VN524_03630 [Hyphomicrobiaceae bacterium]|nr:hypothetical protein [Hyphomicrobiaceae bacterium]